MRKTSILFVGLLLVVSSCGRKNHSLFSFGTSKEVHSVERFLLPVPRNAQVLCAQDAVLFKWDAIDTDCCKYPLAGYVVYRATPYGILSKKPLTPIITENQYSEALRGECPQMFTVKAFFRVDGELFAGPMSRIFSCEKNSLQLRTSWRVGGANNT